MSKKYTVNETLGLAEELGIKSEVIDALKTLLTDDLLDRHESDLTGMTVFETAEAGWKRLKEAYEGKDPDGLIDLGLCLAAACKTRCDYRKNGWSDQIFLDSMGCFPRFIEEDIEQNGKICFTRGFWVWRQTCSRLFRLGTLEFEYRRSSDLGEKMMKYSNGKMILSVHIPSDAVMSDENLKDSYRQALAFFREHDAIICTEGSPVLFFCSTWLLSPELNKLLPEHSRIKRFYSDFEIYDFDQENSGVYNWLFKGQTELEKLPRDTSLQRMVYEHLKNGGKIGAASGIIRF